MCWFSSVSYYSSVSTADATLRDRGIGNDVACKEAEADNTRFRRDVLEKIGEFFAPRYDHADPVQMIHIARSSCGPLG